MSQIEGNRPACLLLSGVSAGAAKAVLSNTIKQRCDKTVLRPLLLLRIMVLAGDVFALHL
jgi:formate-dependent nitrite reductase membrane component NrfD